VGLGGGSSDGVALVMKNGLVVIDMVGLTNPKYQSRSEMLTRPYPRNPKRMLTSKDDDGR
jgi:hypothetical protein